MSECDHDSQHLLANIGCILTYHGSLYHSTINYSLMSVSLFAAARHPTTDPYRAVSALAFTTAFQIALCLIVECSGISIVWCSIAGWLWVGHFYRRRRDVAPLLVQAALLTDGMGILYYFATLPWITTVAHGCAFGMGALLNLLATCSTPNAAPQSSSTNEFQSLRESSTSHIV